MKYRTKPFEVEAMQYVGGNGQDVKNWVNSHTPVGVPTSESWFLTKSMSSPVGNQAWNYVREGKDWGPDIIAAVYDYLHESWVGVAKYQYIVCGMKGEFYPCDPEVFEAKYEEVNDDDD